MPIWDTNYNGTVSYEIARIWDVDNTTTHEIGRVYDTDNTTAREIYSSEYNIFNGTAAAEYTGGWAVRAIAGTSYTAATSGSALSMAQTNYMATTAVVMNSVSSISFSGFSTLNFACSTVAGGNGRFILGVSSNKTNWDVYNTYSSLLAYYQTGGTFNSTVSVSVAGVSSGYIQFSVFGSTANNSISVTKIWLS